MARDHHIVVEVGGIGFGLTVANAALFQQEQELIVLTHLHWSEDQGPTLYGFMSEYERAIFLLIIGCSGIGPKIALAVLEQLTPTTFLKAIQTADIKLISSVNGIGAKKAEQMIVHMKHKVKDLLDKGMLVEHAGDSFFLDQWKEVVQALQSLNYSRQEIDQAMGQVLKDGAGKEPTFDAMLRRALSFLAKRV